MTKEQAFQLREAQSNLALLWELDDHAFQIVTGFAEAWANHCLDSELTEGER